MNDQIKDDYERATGHDHIERQPHDTDDSLKTVDVLGILFFMILAALLVWRFT